jgi:hypothetical protein
VAHSRLRIEKGLPGGMMVTVVSSRVSLHKAANNSLQRCLHTTLVLNQSNGIDREGLKILRTFHWQDISRVELPRDIRLRALPSSYC